ncbi:MAG TPA: hypothetical protein VKB84_13415, partial [Candidatus Binataceae bacterium]|nr:hypothetical protein [Candidatus Binataceae bacterium]
STGREIPKSQRRHLGARYARFTLAVVRCIGFEIKTREKIPWNFLRGILRVVVGEMDGEVRIWRFP